MNSYCTFLVLPTSDRKKKFEILNNSKQSYKAIQLTVHPIINNNNYNLGKIQSCHRKLKNFISNCILYLEMYIILKLHRSKI